ncbi:ribosome quality control complex subunit TCF25-like [Ornithodoros turicata]
MSNRVLKRLQGSNDLEKLDGQSETEDEAPAIPSAEARKNKQLAANRFELLTVMLDHSLSDTEAKEDDDRENEPCYSCGVTAAADKPEGQAAGAIEATGDGTRGKLEKQDSTHSTDSLKRRKKKKKKKKQLQSQHSQDCLDPGEDEVTASVQEVNKILGEPECLPAASSFALTAGSLSHAQKSLLNVDPRNLNAENEMKRIFGSKVVQAEQIKKRGRSRAHGRSTLLVPGKNWSHIGKPGISMNLLETKGDTYFFTFEHSKTYQAVQFQFLDAVETFNPDTIVALLNLHPYHVDALIQFSDICKMGEDFQMAAELIERALYCLESCFHALFNVTQGNCRLDYRRNENRSLFLALFKHLSFVGQRGCSRTALEFCKLLLGLDPEGDPLCVTLMLDYYAVRAEQYEYLVRMYQEWDAARNLSHLPNFAFSVPLAMFHMTQAGSSTVTTMAEADRLLQEALLMFPGALMPLLDKCGIQADSEVIKHTYFGAVAQSEQPTALKQLVSLYVGRNYVLWKEPEVISWLERNVKETIKRISNNDSAVKSYQEKRKKLYQGLPRNIARHILLSNIKEANVTIPQDLANAPIFGFDPLPPADAIVSYTRPSRSQQSGDHGVVGAFFRSLLPSFNLPADAVGIQVNDPAAEHPRGAEGAAARAVDASDLRRSVTSLLDAMRDLLNNIHLTSDVPNDGDVDSDDEREE